MSDVLVVQNTGIEGSGNLGRLLAEDGFRIRTVHAKSEPIPADPHSMLVILGGPQSANDDLQYLRDERQLIRRYVEQERPVLGICLGSQLIAGAFGAPVVRGPATEIGFYNDLHLDTDSGLFSGFSNPFSAFHWHSDTFGLPENAARLAHSEQYENQAFRVGTAVGVQFHLEVDRNMVGLWLDNAEKKLEGMPYMDPQKIRSQIDASISEVESNMRSFYRNFKAEFGL